MFAFAAGGIVGTGLALGSPSRIPAVQTDFIFAAIGEELGLVGTVAVLTAFLLMVAVGLRIALRADQPFDKLLAAGAAAILGVQTFIIVSGVIRLLPLTGITLPFVSYGGSSLITNYILLALLLRVSDTSARHASRRRAVNRSIRGLRHRDDGAVRRPGRPAHQPAGRRRHSISTTTRATPARSSPTSAGHAGAIQTADGVVVAAVGPVRTTSTSTSACTPGTRCTRSLTGYLSFRYGATGVERPTPTRWPARPARARPSDLARC